MSGKRIFLLATIFILASFGLTEAQTGGKVILVSDNEADHAVATIVGDLKGFKVVSTAWGEYNTTVVVQIKALSPREVLIIGGPAAVPSSYETALLEFTNTIRVAGKDRYATMARVLELFKDDFKGRGAVAAYGYDKKGIERALEKAKAKGLILVFVGSRGVSWEIQKALEKANITSLDIEESPNMDITEIIDEIEDDVAEVRITKVNHTTRAAEQIQDARKEINETEKIIAELNVTATAPLKLLENAKERLTAAEKAYDEGKYGRAFGLAVAAEHLAENARKLSKEIKEYVEKSYEKQRELREEITDKISDLKEEIAEQLLKIQEAEAEGINGSEARSYLDEALAALNEAEYSLATNDTSTAVAKLRQARNLLAHANVSLKRHKEVHEKGEEKEIEIEVKIKGGVARITVQINDEKTNFVLHTADKNKIIAQIIEKTGLTKEQVERYIKFEGNHAELGKQRIEKKEVTKKKSKEVKKVEKKGKQVEKKEEAKVKRGEAESKGSKESKRGEAEKGETKDEE